MQLKIRKVLSISTPLSAVGLSVAACSNKSSSSNTKNADHSIALVTDNTGVGDHSSDQSAWGGLKYYGRAHDLPKGNGGHNCSESSPASDHIPNIEQTINAKYEAIVGVDYELGDTINTESEKHPKNNFIMIDNIVDRKNVASATFKSDDALYLAGYIAAYTIKTNVVSFVGSAYGVILNLFDTGSAKSAVDTAEERNRKTEITNAYVGDFLNVDRAKAITKAVYTDEADVIYQIAATTGEGAFQEAKDINTKKAANDKVWVIGADPNQLSLGVYRDKDDEKSNLTLMSTARGIGKAVEDIVNKAYNGGFPGGKHFVYGLKGNGTYVVKGSVSGSTWAAVNKAKQNVIDGKTRVPTTPSD